jgi:hypothetical protein
MYPTCTRLGEHINYEHTSPQSLNRNSEIRKSLKTESFEPHHSRYGWEASVISQTLFNSLGVIIRTLHCTNSSMFDYGVSAAPDTNGDVT